MLECNGCTACCRGDKIHLLPGEDPANWETVERDGRHWLKRVDGNCVYLTDNGCSIHGKAPEMCKRFNCIEYFKGLTRIERKQREKKWPHTKAVFAAARERIAGVGHG